MHDDSLPDLEAIDATLDIEKLVTSLPVDHSGTTVYLKGWRLPGSKRAAIVLVHDLGEHTELYRDTAHDFVRAGHSCYCFDLRGHGRSGRRLGHATSYNVLIHDLLQVTAWVRHLEGGQAPILIGQGIGALIVIDFTKTHGNLCQAAILSAPCLELTGKVDWFTRGFIKFLAETWPTFRIPTTLSPRFSRELRYEQEIEAARKQQTLATFPQLSAIFTNELLSAIQRAEANFIEYHGDVLILCPNRDNICSYGKVRKAAALHNESNVEIIELEDVGHHVFSDSTSRHLALLKILPWLSNLELKNKNPSSLKTIHSGKKNRGLSDFEESDDYNRNTISVAKI